MTIRRRLDVARPLGIGLAAGLAVAALALPPAASAAEPGRVIVVDRMKADGGESVKLFSNKDFRVTGTCLDNGGGDFHANTYLAAKRDDLLYFGDDGDLFDADFDRADGKIDFVTLANDANGMSPQYVGEDQRQDFYAEGRGGKVTQGRVATGVHLKGADCTFSGIFTGTTKSGPARIAKRVKVAAGDSVNLLSNKDFRVRGFCQDNGGGDFRANTFLAAKRDNLIYFASNVGDRHDTDFDIGDGEADFVHDGYDASGADPFYLGHDYYQYFYAEGKGGTVTTGRVATGVHINGADCTFSGIFLGSSGSPRLHPVKRIRADGGERVRLFANDDFRVSGSCEDNGGGDVTANTFLAAKRDHLVYFESDGGTSDLDLGPGDPEVDLTSSDASGTDPEYSGWNSYQDFYAEGRGGRVLQGWIADGVHLKGADCIFSGIFTG